MNDNYQHLRHAFFARPRKTKPQELLLYARLTVSRKLLKFHLKKMVDAESWDQANECIRGKKSKPSNSRDFLMKYVIGYRKTFDNFKLKKSKLRRIH